MSEPTVTRARILVVDHDPDARFHVRGIVTEAGFEVCGEAGLGTEAVVLAVELRPDVVLCALREPVARVEGTIESLARRLPGVPVIAHAETADVSMIRKAMIAGARDFVRAPFTPDEVQRSVAAVLVAEQRRHDPADNATASGAIVTVFGAKGGIGKTTLAVNLSVALTCHTNQSVVLVDADDTFGDVAATLSVMPGGSATEALQTDGDADVERLLCRHSSGLAVLAGPESPFEWDGLHGARLGGLLQQLARRFDVVIVDTSGALRALSLAAIESSSLVFWVTTAEYASVRDSVQAMKALQSRGLADDRLRIVLNAASSDIEVHPGAIEEALGRPIFWSIPYDRKLRASAQLGRTLVDAGEPRSPAAVSMRDLALTLSGLAPDASRTGLLGRLAAAATRAAPAREPFRPTFVKKEVEQ